MQHFALVLLLFSKSTFLQNCDSMLSGTVVDMHDGTLLSGATLIIAGIEQEVQTDSKGRFTFSNLCDQTYTLQVSHPYCLTSGFKIKISGNTSKVFKLEHHIEELNEIIIQGKNNPAKSKTLKQTQMSNAALERYSSGSLGDALNSISGVSSLNTGNTVVKPMINGLHSSRVLIINNGVRMQDQEWGAEHAPNLDINSIGTLTLIKGAGALQFGGDAVGGVIVTETPKPLLKDSLFGKTFSSAATNGRGGMITSQLTRSFQNGWYGTVQGTLKRFGDFKSPEYILSNTGTFERSVSLNWGLNRLNFGLEAYYSFFKNEIGILRASHLGGAQDQIRAIESSIPLIVNDFDYAINAPMQEVDHHLFRIKGFKRLKGLGKLSLQYDFQKNDRLEFDIRRGSDRNKASLDLELDTHSLQFDLNTSLTADLNLKTGLLSRYQNNFAEPNTGVRRLIPDYKKYDLGVFSILNYRPNNQWLFEAGARFDFSYLDVYKFYRTSFWEFRNYDELFPELVVRENINQILTHPELKFYNPSATVGVHFNFDQDFNLLLNYSIASRAPNPSELFSEGLHHSASRIELGDLRFESEFGHKVSLALERDGDRFGFSINPFFQSISNFIILEPTTIQQTVRGNFQVWEYRQTHAELLGLDLDLTYRFSNTLSIQHQSSLVKGYDRTKDEALISMPPVNTSSEIVYQNPKYKNIRLALQSAYFFRQNEYPNVNFEVYLPQEEQFKLVDVSTPPDAYHLLNFNSSIDLKSASFGLFSIGLTITNLLNTSYRNYLNRLRFYADDLGRNFLIKLKFNY